LINPSSLTAFINFLTSLRELTSFRDLEVRQESLHLVNMFFQQLQTTGLHHSEEFKKTRFLPTLNTVLFSLLIEMDE